MSTRIQRAAQAVENDLRSLRKNLEALKRLEPGSTAAGMLGQVRRLEGGMSDLWLELEYEAGSAPASGVPYRSATLRDKMILLASETDDIQLKDALLDLLEKSASVSHLRDAHRFLTQALSSHDDEVVFHKMYLSLAALSLDVSDRYRNSGNESLRAAGDKLLSAASLMRRVGKAKKSASQTVLYKGKEYSVLGEEKTPYGQVYLKLDAPGTPQGFLWADPKDIGKGRSRRRPSKKPPTPRQLSYAQSLLRRVTPQDWHDTSFGEQGTPIPTPRELDSWDRSDVSALIDELKAMFR